MHLFSGFWMFLCYFRYLNNSYRADFSNFAPFLQKVTPQKGLDGYNKPVINKYNE